MSRHIQETSLAVELAHCAIRGDSEDYCAPTNLSSSTFLLGCGCGVE